MKKKDRIKSHLVLSGKPLKRFLEMLEVMVGVSRGRHVDSNFRRSEKDITPR